MDPSIFVPLLSDKLHNILLSQQLCTFRLLFAWRDNIAREEDESYGWENFLCCIFNTFMFLISRKLCIGAVVEYLIFCLFVCFICYMYLFSWLVWWKMKILVSFFQLCSSQSHYVSDCRDYAKVKVMKVL